VEGRRGGELKSGGGVTGERFIGGEMEVKWREVYGIEGPELCLSFVCGAAVEPVWRFAHSRRTGESEI